MRLRQWCDILLLIATLASCSDGGDDGSEPAPAVRYDMVTYLGPAADGSGEQLFEYLGRDDSTAITLQGTVAQMADSLKVGRRGLLHYTVLGRTSDTRWHVRADYLVTGVVVSDTLRVTSQGTTAASLAMHPLRLRALWRGGSYLNARFELEWTGKTRSLALVADRTTAGADTVHCYLTHDLLGADTTYFWRTAYGSFFVGSLLQSPTARVMRVHVADVIRPSQDHYDFTLK